MRLENHPIPDRFCPEMMPVIPLRSAETVFARYSYSKPPHALALGKGNPLPLSALPSLAAAQYHSFAVPLSDRYVVDNITLTDNRKA